MRKIYDRYRAVLRYDGRNFHGFQVQPDRRTVQGEVCRALALTLGRDVKVTGCSRTDAGVHANFFVIRIDAPGATVPPDRLPIAAAEYLPSDVSITSAEACEEDFHPRYDVRSKEYLYRILNAKVNDPFEVGRAWFLPRTVTDEGLGRMREGAKYLLGKHDFSSFMSVGSDTDDTVRNVYALSVERTGDIVSIRISADGFLYNMVRIIVGTLCEVAFGRFEPSEIPCMLEAKNRKAAGMTAPADGLYLNRVEYPD